MDSQTVTPEDPPVKSKRFIRPKVLRERLDISPTTEWRLRQIDPDFPRLVELPNGMKAYVEDEYDAYAELLIARRDAAHGSNGHEK
jgi:predicted DNA-binding transcriptional regulator AlpA